MRRVLVAAILLCHADAALAQRPPNQDERCHQDYTDAWVCAHECGDSLENGCWMLPVVAGRKVGIVAPELPPCDPHYSGEPPRALLECIYATKSVPVWTTVPHSEFHRAGENAVVFWADQALYSGDSLCRIFVWNVGAGGWFWRDDHSGHSAIGALLETTRLQCFVGHEPVMIEGLERVAGSDCARVVRHSSGKIGTCRSTNSGIPRPRRFRRASNRARHRTRNSDSRRGDALMSVRALTIVFILGGLVLILARAFTTVTNVGQTSLYTVQPGDTLSGIPDRHRTTVEVLAGRQWPHGP